MLWQGRPLREIRNADIQRLVDSGLEEHLQLEYKSELYDDSDRGRKEFLLDICMFANTAGGVLLIGIPERRGDSGQPTGVPDSGTVLGIEIANPEAVLGGYDARVMEAIEERLPLESAAIDVGNGRRILALRVPNSGNKPHSVRHQGHIYFPARRERQRYHMNVREIRELIMRTASRIREAQGILHDGLLDAPRGNDLPYLQIGMIPLFFEDFLIDIRDAGVRRAVGNFNRAEQPEYVNPTYAFDGLERREDRFDYTVRLGRNGFVSVSLQLPLHGGRGGAGQHVFAINAIDVQLRRFMLRASAVYQAAAIGPPFILGMMLRAQRPLTGAYAADGGVGEHHQDVGAGVYNFPYVEIYDAFDNDPIIRPLCDQAHQMFGRERSASFDADGSWMGRYA
jgi:hypothetical protein